MSETIINDIDLSKYFKNHYDSWGRLYCIEYKGNPLELQNDIKRLQEENEELKGRNANLRLNLATYDLPEIKKVLTDWRTGELDKKFKKLQKENEKLKEKLSDAEAIMITHRIVKEQYKQTLEEIREIAKYSVMHNSELNANYQIILQKISEVLNDNRD